MNKYAPRLRHREIKLLLPDQDAPDSFLLVDSDDGDCIAIWRDQALKLAHELMRYAQTQTNGGVVVISKTGGAKRL